MKGEEATLGKRKLRFSKVSYLGWRFSQCQRVTFQESSFMQGGCTRGTSPHPPLGTAKHRGLSAALMCQADTGSSAMPFLSAPVEQLRASTAESWFCLLHFLGSDQRLVLFSPNKTIILSACMASLSMCLVPWLPWCTPHHVSNWKQMGQLRA